MEKLILTFLLPPPPPPQTRILRTPPSSPLMTSHSGKWPFKKMSGGLRKILNSPPLYRTWDLKNSDVSSYILWALGLRKIPSFSLGLGENSDLSLSIRLWDIEKIRATSSTDMKHVSIAWTWTGIFKSQNLCSFLPQ